MSTRSELKENMLASKMEGSLGWFNAHRVPVFASLGIGVAVMLIASVFIIRKRERTEIEWTRLAQAQGLLGEKRFEVADGMLNDIANTNAGTLTAAYAHYHLAESQLEQKKFNDAIKSLGDVVAQTTDKPLRPIALSNLGFAQEQKGDFTGAAQTYRQFLEQYGDHFLAARTQLRLGLSLIRGGDIDGGKKALGQLIDLYPTSPWSENARRFMDKSKTR